MSAEPTIGTQEPIATASVDPQGEAFPVEGEGYKNTNSAGGILTILLFLVCLFFVAEAVVHIIFKKRKKKQAGGNNDASGE